MKILNYGSLNIDLVYRVQHIVKAGETIASRSFREHAGGKGANQSAAIAQAGAKIYHAGKVGLDGRWLVKKTAGFGVNTRFIRVAEEKTGHAVIQIDRNGENAIFLHPGANHRITRTEIDDVLYHFSAGDVLLLQNEINEIVYLINAAYKKKMRICLNPSPVERQIAEYPLHKVNMLILNEIEGSALAGRVAPEGIMERLADKYPKAEIVLTLGKKGAIARLPGGRTIKQSSFRIKPVDTTAAGDTFIGYYVAGRVMEKSPAECLRQACAAAAICATRPGAMDSIPPLRQVRAFLRQGRQKRSFFHLT